MEQRELEVTIISAQDLKNVKNFGGKMSPYAVAWIYPEWKMRTPMATNAGTAPTWNEKLPLICEERLIEQGTAIITVDLYNQGSISTKSIGTVSIPVSQWSGGKANDSKSGSEAKFLSLQVRRPSGRAQGNLNVSVKLGKVTTVPVGTAYGAATGLGQGKGNVPVMAYPAGYPGGYAQPGSSQYPQFNQGYPQQYPPQYAQGGYYPQQGYQNAPPRRSGFGGAGLGTGLLGGALGGFLLGDMLGGGFGGDGGGGGGGCGGGGCGG